MQKLKIILTPKSSFITDLQSDTIFGHICWAIKYLKGENRLEEFLKSYQEKPPLLISSGFPRIKIDKDIIQLIPKPILKPLSPTEENNLFNQFFKNNKKDRLLFSYVLKKLKKQQYISLNAFEKIKNNLSYVELYKTVFSGEFCPQNFIPKPKNCDKNFYECPFINYEKDIKECPKIISLYKSEEVYHNTKNRITDTVEKEGGLFSVHNTFYNDNIEIVIYLKSNYDKSFIEKIFDFISKSGFGADKSTGKGQFDFKIEENFQLPESDNPNGFLSLSNYYPTKNEFKDGYYETIVKFGKLGGDWAKAKGKTYFKKPIIFIAPGATFITDEKKEFYGSLVPNVHTDERIVQYGYTIPLYVRMV